jgi:protein-S-isoprenylcysteine O-methyltransferase Ste14
MPVARRARRLAGNYLTTLAFIGLSCWVVSDLSAFHRDLLQGWWRFELPGFDAVVTIRGLFLFLIALYAVVLIPYYLKYPWLHSKAFLFLQGLVFSGRRMFRPASRARRANLDHDRWRLPFNARLSPMARQAGLTLMLKFFFAPLMINWCLEHAGQMGNALVQFRDSFMAGVAGRQLFDSSLYWACFQAILFVDTLLFTLGYILETPALRNRIRSVDPTFFGWFICLACYPPFNGVTSRIFEWQSSDFPQFQGDTAHFVANITLLAALAIYSWASIALGFKASNLTNRGIVNRGPYSRVRHPAYTAKNLAWWIGALPNLYLLIGSGDWRRFGYALFALIAWTAIYALRAITEERHLLMGNNGYADYMQRVRWRFIPGVI